MPKRQQRAQPPRSRRGKAHYSPTYFNPSAIRYTGPISSLKDDSMVVNLYDDASISSDVAGLIAGTFGTNPSNCRNWSEYSTSWGEYRVLGIRFTYVSQFAANTTTISGFSGYHSIVNGPNVTAPATLGQAASTGISRLWNPWRNFVREWRMSEISQAVFTSTAAPASLGATFNVYGQNATVSTLYGNLQLEYLVQFRTHIL